jgi:hypothetical protein
MVGHGLVCSRNLVFILHLYLVFGGNLINCYKLYKSANSPAALISVTNEANVVKIQNIKISRQRSTVKERQLTSSFLILHGMKLFLNTSTAALLISLSGDVENNPGPFDTAILNPENSTINRQSTLRDSRSTVNCAVINARSLTSMHKANDEVFSNMNCTQNFLTLTLHL